LVEWVKFHGTFTPLLQKTHNLFPMLKENFTRYILQSIAENREKKALTDYEGETFTYGDVELYISRMHKFFRAFGLQEGDKVALVGKNSSRWGIVYLAVVTYGAVIVPVLPDFREDDLHEIIAHSDAILLFAGESFLDKVDYNRLAAIRATIAIESFSRVWARTPEDTAAPDAGSERTGEHFHVAEVPNDRLAVISYTSGTTGNTKGVMITHNALAANVRYARNNMPLKSGDPIVSFLPLAHTFGCAFEFLFPFSLGCHITILTKTPSPQIIIRAFQEIRPALVLTVPLVIEKIFVKQILPVISKPAMKTLLAIPVLNLLIRNKIKKKLVQVFGGRFLEIVIGGAPLNHQAERFFKKIGFPFTVGYGMTECGPLISYAPWTENPLRASGRAIDTLDIRIDSNDPVREVGEIMVKGENVLPGYYKNEKATKEILDEEGWLHTGDLGLLDKKGFVYIKGRNKSMFLGANGRNIYPENIESIFDTKPGIAETLVVQRGEKLVALMYPDKEYQQKEKLTDEQLRELLEQNLKAVNNHLPSYIHIAELEIRDTEFQKTPKRNIRRFLYH